MGSIISLDRGDAGPSIDWSEATHRAVRIQVSRFAKPEQHHEINPDLDKISWLASYLWSVTGSTNLDDARAIVILASLEGLDDHLNSRCIVRDSYRRRSETLRVIVEVQASSSLVGLIERAWSQCSAFGIFYRVRGSENPSVDVRRIEGRRYRPIEVPSATPAYLGKYCGEHDQVLVVLQKEWNRPWKELWHRFA